MGDLKITPLDVLEAKVSAIELKLFGTDWSSESFQNTCGSENVTDALIKSQTIINTAISGQEKINKMVKRMEELDAVLDPAFETTPMRDAAKLEMLLLMYDRLHEVSTQLKTLKESSDVLNSEQIRNVLKCEDRLTALMKNVHEHVGNVETSTEAVRQFLTEYNRLVNSCTTVIAQMDEIVTGLEIANEPKKILE